jgi:hypothetical protein
MPEGDAAAPPAPASAPRRGCRRCGLCGALLVLLLVGLPALYLARVSQLARAAAPLPFAPFAYKPLERSLLSAKFDFLEMGGRFLGSSTDVTLDEREVNALLFGEASQTDDRKARVLLDEDRLVVELSAPRQADDPKGGFVNLRVTVRPSLGPSTNELDVQDVELGGVRLDPLARAVVRRWLEGQLVQARARDPKLGRLKALWVEDGHVRLVYDPPPG